MNIKTTYTITAIAVLFSMSFIIGSKNTAPQNKPITKALWLIGEWQHKTSRGILYEQWKQTSDSLLSGKSYYLRDKDTITLETIALKQDKQTLWYIPTVSNQNNAQPVRFKLTDLTRKKLVFENPEHDFPQKITYTLISQDSLIAEISGTVNGKLRKERFPMRRSRYQQSTK